jgi:MSHA biogenesis protein MshP
MRRDQRGLGAIAAIMILVILAALAAAIVTFSSGQQLASAQDIQAVRAWMSASAGTEWGLSRAIKSNACGTSTWAHPDYADFKVTVECVLNTYNDGESAPGVQKQVRVFRITATACNGAAATCPDNAMAASPAYIERQRVAVAYCDWNGAACTGPGP